MQKSAKIGYSQLYFCTLIEYFFAIHKALGGKQTRFAKSRTVWKSRDFQYHQIVYHLHFSIFFPVCQCFFDQKEKNRKLFFFSFQIATKYAR